MLLPGHDGDECRAIDFNYANLWGGSKSSPLTIFDLLIDTRLARSAVSREAHPGVDGS